MQVCPKHSRRLLHASWCSVSGWSSSKQRPNHLHCHVGRSTEVKHRDAPGSFPIAPTDLPGDAFYPYCFGRAIMMTLVVMRDLLGAAAVVPVHAQDDAYVTGDLALAQGIGHVAIDDLCEWDAQKTDCIFRGRGIFAHELSPYDLTTGRRAKWALLLWRYRLYKGDGLDLSKRLEVGDYREMFQETKMFLSSSKMNLRRLDYSGDQQPTYPEGNSTRVGAIQYAGGVVLKIVRVMFALLGI